MATMMLPSNVTTDAGALRFDYIVLNVAENVVPDEETLAAVQRGFPQTDAAFPAAVAFVPMDTRLPTKAFTWPSARR